MGELTQSQVQELKMWAEKDLMLDGAKGVLIRSDDLLALLDAYTSQDMVNAQYEAMIENLEGEVDALRDDVLNLEHELEAVTEALDA